MKNKRIVVTGGCGFVGSNLVDMLCEDKQNEVIVVDDLSSGNREYCRDDVKYYFSDFKYLLRCDFEKGVDVIFHLAAQARIQPSFEKPLHTCENNAFGTAIVCDFARRNGCMVVYAGSSSFYGGVYLNPYAFAKWQGEEVIKMYSKVYGVKAAIARFFNVYGPRNPLIGQYTPVVAIFEEQKKENLPLTIVGDGEQRRDFTHVHDICSGLIHISKKDRGAEIFNLGTGRNYSINELADLFGGEKSYFPARPGEASVTLADISKSTEIGWFPKHSLEEYVEQKMREIV